MDDWIEHVAERCDPEDDYKCEASRPEKGKHQLTCILQRTHKRKHFDPLLQKEWV